MIRRALRGLFEITKIASLWAVIALLCYVLMNAAILESNYIEKYEVAHRQMELEHERNMVIGYVMRSQHAWEQSALALRTAYGEERADRIRAQRELAIHQHEVYAFLKVLEQKYPGATMEVLTQIGPPQVPLAPPQPTLADPATKPQEPECEDGSCTVTIEPLKE